MFACVQNPGVHRELHTGPSEGGVSLYHVLRQLERGWMHRRLQGTCEDWGCLQG